MVKTEGFLLRDLSFAYGTRPALSRVSACFTPGLFYGIVGPNGSGKSTLLDLLMGRRRPDTGTILFQGRPPSSYPRRRLARQLALVPQDFAIRFDFSVEEAVLMGRHPHMPRFGGPTGKDLDLSELAMTELGVSHLRHRLVPTLSGGEKQRVAVARALAQDSSFLLLDEATSSLDIRHTLDIMATIKRRVRELGRTAIAVIHNLNLAAACCDRVLFLKEGAVVADGPMEQVMTPAMIQKVFGVTAQVRHDHFCGGLQVLFRFPSGQDTPRAATAETQLGAQT